MKQDDDIDIDTPGSGDTPGAGDTGSGDTPGSGVCTRISSRPNAVMKENRYSIGGILGIALGIVQFILLPFHGIVDYVMCYALVIGIIPNDVFVETGMPCEMRICFAGMDGYHAFVLVDDDAQCAGFPFVGCGSGLG